MDMRTKKYDNVNNPRHYNKEGVECIDGIKSSMSEKEFLGYLKGNTIKYLWRYDYKEKLQREGSFLLAISAIIAVCYCLAVLYVKKQILRRWLA